MPSSVVPTLNRRFADDLYASEIKRRLGDFLPSGDSGSLAWGSGGSALVSTANMGFTEIAIV